MFRIAPASPHFILKNPSLVYRQCCRFFKNVRGKNSEASEAFGKDRWNTDRARIIKATTVAFGVLLSSFYAYHVNQSSKAPNLYLSKEQLDAFDRDGYLVIKKLFSSKEISEINTALITSFHKAKAIAAKAQLSQNIQPGASFRCVYEGNSGNSASIKAISNTDGSTSVQLISWIGGVKPELIALSRQDKLKIPVSQILESSSADHLINQVHYKMPSDKVSFPWHQDIQNRRRFDPNWEDLNGKGSFVQVLTAVDKITKENGPLIIIKGSHKKDLHLENKKEPTKRLILKEYPNLEWTPMTMNPGDTLFMHPLILHKSEPNNSSVSRMMFINGFSYPGANKIPYPGSGSTEHISLT